MHNTALHMLVLFWKPFEEFFWVFLVFINKECPLCSDFGTLICSNMPENPNVVHIFVVVVVILETKIANVPPLLNLISFRNLFGPFCCCHLSRVPLALYIQ